MLPSEYQLTVK